MPVLTSAVRKIRKSGPNPTTNRRESGAWSWGSRNHTGVAVNDESALALSTFYRGVNLIATRCATLPFHVYRDEGDKPARVRTPETSYLWRRPNNENNRVVFWRQIFADIVRGNAFIWVEKDATGMPAHIWRIPRNRVQVGRTEDGLKVYKVGDELPMIDYKEGGEIVHIPNWGDSLLGYNVVKVAAEAIALGISAQEYAARTFTQGDVPPGIITTEQALTPAQAEEVATAWHAQHAGLKNAGKTAVIGNGGKFQQTMIDLEKMQMEKLRNFQAGEMATLLGVPPHMLGLTDRSTSWGSGIAEQTQGFVTYTLDGYIKNVEVTVDDDLLVRELTDLYLQLDLGGLLRGTTLQRYQAHALGYGRWLSTNDIRRDEDLPPVEGGDNVLAAVNLVPLDELAGISSLGQDGSGE